MPELFIYDGSEQNRGVNFFYHQNPIMLGFREALRALNPPIPFLIRGVNGDYDHKDNKSHIKNTFGGEQFDSFLSKVLLNGHDKYNLRGRGRDQHPSEEAFVSKRRLKYCDIIWADEFNNTKKVKIYPLIDRNIFSMVINSSFYESEDKNLFFQPNIEKRRRGLLGIIISYANPEGQLKKPLRFKLNLENLEKVVGEIEKAGYFKA